MSNPSPAAPVIYLLDTNILVRQADAASPQRAIVLSAIKSLRLGGAGLTTSVQTLMEFWVVATRPIAKNGLGLSVADTQKLLAGFEMLYPPLPEAPGVYAEWKRLVSAYGAQGKPAHDARFVAAMRIHGSVTHLLTFNAADFNRYVANEGITVVDPGSIPVPVLK